MADWFNNTSIKILNGDDFHDITPWKMRNESRCCFVLFFAEWCGHCKNIKPEYIKFGDIAQFIRTFAVDTVKNATLIDRISESDFTFSKDGSKAEITGYPTIWIYKDGVPYEEYTGANNWRELLVKAKKVCNEVCNCDTRKRNEDFFERYVI